MKQVRLVFTFYKSFIMASGIITLACISTVYMNGLKMLSALLLFKLFTCGLIILYISLYKKNEFYYYHNLGLSKLRLWLYTIGVDLILFILLTAAILWML